MKSNVHVSSEAPATTVYSVRISRRKWLNRKDVEILSVIGNQEGVCIDNSSS